MEASRIVPSMCTIHICSCPPCLLSPSLSSVLLLSLLPFFLSFPSFFPPCFLPFLKYIFANWIRPHNKHPDEETVNSQHPRTPPPSLPPSSHCSPSVDASLVSNTTSQSCMLCTSYKVQSSFVSGSFDWALWASSMWNACSCRLFPFSLLQSITL